MSNYYATLGLQRDCKDSDIEPAYRKLAFKWHPDINKSKEALTNFQKISEAYEVLSDPSKRNKFDAYESHPNLKNPSVFHFTSTSNANDVFEKIFKRAATIGIQQTHQRPQYQATAASATLPTPITCTMEEIYKGKKKIMKVKNSTKDKMIVVNIPPGCPEGNTITVKDSDSNDHVFSIHAQDHEIFMRNGYDLHITETLSLTDFVNGFSLVITTLTGNKKKVSHKYAGKTINVDGVTLKVPGLGMPKPQGGSGLLVIHFKIHLPVSL
jgi:curved DNA-binding protein